MGVQCQESKDMQILGSEICNVGYGVKCGKVESTKNYMQHRKVRYDEIMDDHI